MKCLIICVQSLLLMAAITATPQGELTNVALHKPASQSSEYGEYTQPEKVVDGIRATNIRECTHTSGHELNPWWRVDLQGDFKIFAVVITNRGDCCGDRLANFDVYVTDDVFDPKLTRPGVSQRCVHQDTAPDQGATVRYNCNQPVTGQYITLVLNTEDGYLNFCELEALGTAVHEGELTNVALHKPASQSSEYGQYTQPGKVVDGNKASNIRECTHTSGHELNPWWRVDLQGDFKIFAVVITNRGDCCGDRLSNFDVYVTDDVFDPKLTRPGVSQRCVHQDTAPGQGATVRYDCNQPVTGQYITLVLNTVHNHLNFCELEALGTAVHEVPIRLVGGRNNLEGRVEIRVGQRWGTICDDGWDNNDARVVCNMLGFFRFEALATSSAFFGEGSGPIVLDDVNCDGSEQDIRVCSARAFGTHNCAHSEDAGVVCIG